MRLGKPADLFLPTKIVTVLTFLYTGRKKSLFLCTFAVILYNTEMSDVLVIIPTYNEIENISAILEKVMKYPDNFDVLVIDDNSPDGTADAVRKVMEQFPGREIGRAHV